MSATQMPTKLQLRGPKAPPYDPRSDEHWQRFSQMLTFNVAFVLYSLVISSVCAFATFDVKKAAYKVPPPPPNRPNSPSYYTPGYQGWLISETSRLGLACISLILCGASLWKFHDATMRDHERPTKNLVFRSLLNKIIWYPLLQAVTRVPCIYTIIFGSYNAIQLNGVAGADKLFLYYLYALLSPSGGILMMLVFLRNNAAAKQWCLESYRKCCSGLDHNDQSLLDAYAQGQDAANARRSSAAFADEEAGVQSSVYGRPSGAPSEKIQALLVQRCDDMDEGELTNILSSGAVASEEQWQSSVLRQDGRWMGRSSISRRIWLSLKSALSTKRAIVRRESSRAGGLVELADRRASRSRSPSFTTGARRSISESPGTGRRLSLSSSSFPASGSVSTLPPPPPPPSPQLLERTARRPSSGRRASAPAGAYMLLHSSTLLVLLLSVAPTSALYNTTRSSCSSAAASASAEPAIFIIADMQPQTAVQERVAQHVRELAALFAPIKPVIVPPIFARKCNAQSHSLSQPHSPSSAAVNDKGHGSNLAHWSAWNNFARNSEACSLLVFEYDAFAASPMASADALTVARTLANSSNQHGEFHFLGYCYAKPGNHPALSSAAPYCLHAYAVSLAGVRKLLEHVDTCGLFADTQVADMCNRGILRWNYTASAAHDRAFVQHLFFSDGLKNGPFHFSGSFVQAKYDDHPAALGLSEGDLVAVKSKGRAIFSLGANTTWHRLGSAQELEKRGRNKHNIRVLSNWQFRQWREGNATTAGEGGGGGGGGGGA